jgi:hypothetical protein
VVDAVRQTQTNTEYLKQTSLMGVLQLVLLNGALTNADTRPTGCRIIYVEGQAFKNGKICLKGHYKKIN